MPDSQFSSNINPSQPANSQEGLGATPLSGAANANSNPQPQPAPEWSGGGASGVPTTSSIYTMPDKFLGSQPSPMSGSAGSSPSGRKWILIIAIVALVLAGITFGAYWYLNSSFNPIGGEDVTSNANDTLPAGSTDNVNQPANTAPTDNTNTVSGSVDARQRDSQRIVDLVELAKALDTYYGQFASYPQFLSLIPSSIMSELPKDPRTNSPYTYLASTDRASYEIVFDIEESAEFKDEILTAGTYKLSPEDFRDGSQNTNDPQSNTNQNPDASQLGNLDEDGDGLTTAEERLFRTSPVSRDTDADGYDDGVEVSNFYSPIRSNAVKLDEEGLVRIHTNSTYQFSFPYPAAWITSVVSDGREVLVTSDTGEDFSITIEDNPDNKTSWEWYVENVSQDYNRDSVDIITIAGREAVRTKDGLSAYVVNGSYAFGISYNVRGVSYIQYPSVFNLLITRFSF